MESGSGHSIVVWVPGVFVLWCGRLAKCCPDTEAADVGGNGSCRRETQVAAGAG
jgi:hypothetical protein